VSVASWCAAQKAEVRPRRNSPGGLILSLARHIAEEDKGAARGGHWQSTIGFALEGKILGVLGLGRLGSQMARIGNAFRHEDDRLEPEPDERTGGGCRRDVGEKDELFGTADVLTIHLLLSERTRGLVGSNEIALMKKSAILVNTARAGIVDETALIEGLKTGAIAGAGLDVPWARTTAARRAYP